MAKYNILQEKSFKFAVRMVNLYKHLCEIKKEYVLSKQILRSGTSIGANIEEGIGGQSDKDFFAKLNISYKEMRETIYWLKLLKETEYITKEQYTSLFADADELGKILGKIKITMSKKLNPLNS
ncbi:MAG: four helix bundle protein [Dysgonamonadaceae bacterium]|jgi:four helix bundle protein|nr:four helix bundle protein [Dysgonamonadaceae bacterium]